MCFLDFTRIDKYVVHFCGEDWVGELAEERLEQGGHHVHVVPLGVVQLKQAFLSASIDLKEEKKKNCFILVYKLFRLRNQPYLPASKSFFYFVLLLSYSATVY